MFEDGQACFGSYPRIQGQLFLVFEQNATVGYCPEKCVNILVRMEQRGMERGAMIGISRQGQKLDGETLGSGIML